MIALYMVYAQVDQLFQGFFGFDKFGDGLHTHGVPYLVDGFHHGVINIIVGQLAHEGAVDFKLIHRQVFQITVGGKTSPEIIQ